jgi:translation initiation factor IF-2
MGVVIESSLDKGLGNVATVLIKSGTLKKGDFIIAGSSIGHIRMMFDENLKELKEALPSTPVKITGLNSTPDAGENFIVSNNEKEIKEIAAKIELSKRTEHLYSMQSNLSQNEEGTKTLNLIIKTDVSGTLEAIKGTLSKIEIDGAKTQIIRSSVGGITDTDVNLSKSSNAIIIGFNIKPSRALKDSADKAGVKILFYNIIYKLKEDVEKFLTGSLDPIMVEKETGEAKIQQI